MMVARGQGAFHVEIKTKEPGVHYQPSADLLFESASVCAGPQTIGGILTGMGNDGCRGFKHIKLAGGITIAESERTAIIFGMPQEAIRAGVVDHILPLTEIAGALKTLCKL